MMYITSHRLSTTKFQCQNFFYVEKDAAHAKRKRHYK